MPTRKGMSPVLRFLLDIRNDLPEWVVAESAEDPRGPRLGCAEWEVARAFNSPPLGGGGALRELTRLRQEGKVTRSGGYCWVREDYFQRWKQEQAHV